MDMNVAREWLVTLTEDVTHVDAAADALAARHGFAVSARIGVLRSFVATMTNATIAQVGREPSVTRILRNLRLRASARLVTV